MPTAREERLLGRGTWPEVSRVSKILRTETAGGALVFAATLVALAMANSPLRGLYVLARDTSVGFASLHLDLTIEAWASDGLLAIFFFVVGLELKREFISGDLRTLVGSPGTELEFAL